jgi:hypothetical protein
MNRAGRQQSSDYDALGSVILTHNCQMNATVSNATRHPHLVFSAHERILRETTRAKTLTAQMFLFSAILYLFIVDIYNYAIHKRRALTDSGLISF